MKKLVPLIGAVLLLAVYNTAFSQCENCPTHDDFSSDLCYTDDRMEDLCAQFGLDEDHVALSNRKKKKLIPLAENDSLEYYVGLATTRQYKLKAIELLFLQEAIAHWNRAKRDIGMDFTDSGLGIKIIEEGDGEHPQKGQQVTVHYTGTLEDGTKFDSSLDRNQPFTFTLGEGRVIKGWDEGIALLQKGSKVVLKIPSELGYGARGAGGVIPPNATLYFEVELISFE